jgi:hypothetical protein|nr:MAG TPA: hypothetical protein [Caudoviricetes sp.]
MDTKKLSYRQGEYALTPSEKYADTYTLRVADLVDFVGSEDDAEDLARTLLEFSYNEAIKRCEKQAETGDLLMANSSIEIDTRNESGEYGWIKVSTRYFWGDDVADIEVDVYVDSIMKDEADEDDEEIEDNVKYNDVLRALKSEAFHRKMDDGERGEFECIYDKSVEAYRKLHPEEFEDED